ncbi:hypothetical protein MANES_09G009201v8 [Manihot esculenta]|uniref:Uncharacterized protein n=1 Tax=Manihot esculenta TaxID=3983 RepID=A0ACB7H308_MANES|nr:hypothetical protein MANES_09G009201v8 [Manihot esculenta]
MLHLPDCGTCLLSAKGHRGVLFIYLFIFLNGGNSLDKSLTRPKCRYKSKLTQGIHPKRVISVFITKVYFPRGLELPYASLEGNYQNLSKNCWKLSEMLKKIRNFIKDLMVVGSPSAVQWVGWSLSVILFLC